MNHHNLAVQTFGSGARSAILAIHGGRGPGSMQQLAARLGVEHEVVLPTHPGWDGQPRDSAISSVPDLAQRYLTLLLDANLADVTVVASSFGGWIAAEMALLAQPEVIGRMVLLNPVGPAPTPSEIARQSPTRSTEVPDPYMDLVRSYTGPMMCSPDLSERLGAVAQPTLIVWGADDPVLPPAYGQRMATDLADATCLVVPGAGHLPHLEAPEQTLTAIRGFLDGTSMTTVTR
ncbi:alpha/beta hydrolase [Rhodococcus ruber]|uniref:Alpha/beta hydrolase n=1 Tax=Rhodococcus ruber TaxID=1830 RepID=A0ABT4M7G5_9NOCA|nr:alpha/beta hydrolase [Rhodococcus ruber]MCZ4516882.1 alpha/beta hydrolase [Rhodococcus ruber]